MPICAGVEGTMRRCCEETLRVLRQHKDFLLTIIEVLIHDPLYKWGLTAEGAQKRQRGESEDDGENDEDGEEATALTSGLIANADAERALLRIRHKLEGTEQGELQTKVSSTHIADLLFWQEYYFTPMFTGRDNILLLAVNLHEDKISFLLECFILCIMKVFVWKCKSTSHSCKRCQAKTNRAIIGRHETIWSIDASALAWMMTGILEVWDVTCEVIERWSKSFMHGSRDRQTLRCCLSLQGL